LTGYIVRRRGQQEEGARNLERAVELDPRNPFSLQQLAVSYQFLRRYPEEATVLDRALTIVPNDAATKTARALVDFYWKAETRSLHQTIDSILAAGPSAISDAADSWFICALAERDPTAAERALVALGDNPFWFDNPVILSRSFGEGLLARVMKDEAKAHAAFTGARLEQEKIVQAQPDYGPPLCAKGGVRSNFFPWKKIQPLAVRCLSVSRLSLPGRARRTLLCSTWRLTSNQSADIPLGPTAH
jgi:tetratricopeptide (TPR) repeat protein